MNIPKKLINWKKNFKKWRVHRMGQGKSETNNKIRESQNFPKHFIRKNRKLNWIITFLSSYDIICKLIVSFKQKKITNTNYKYNYKDLWFFIKVKN